MTSLPDDDAEVARPQLLFFFDPTDGRARRVEAYIAQVLQRRQNHDAVRVRPVDVTRHGGLAERLRVYATPTLLVVEAMTVKARIEQPKSSKAIQELLTPWLR